MDVTAIGRTRMLYDAIRDISRAGHRIERIVTTKGMDFYEVTVADFRQLANDIDAEFIVPDDINDPDLISMFKKSDSEISISINWPTVIGQQVLDAFECGVVNGHAGDLPRYRGNAAPNWAIINGEDEIVLTIHRMTEEFDAGPILVKHHISIDEDTYIGDIYEEMYEVFPELFADVVGAAANGSLNPKSQPSDPSSVLRGYPRKPVDSELEWEKPASYLARVVRASAEPFFGAYTWLDGKKLRVWRAYPEHPAHNYLGTPGQVAECRPQEGNVAVVTGDGFLVLDTVQFDKSDQGRKLATEIIDTTRTRLGMDITGTLSDLRSEIVDLRCRIDDLEDQS